MPNACLHVRTFAPGTRLARLIIAAFALAVLASQPAAAQSADAPYQRNSFPIFFDFFGTWRGEGVVGGWPAKTEMTWSPVIDGHFVRVSWTSDMTSKSGEQVRFESEGTYRPVADDDGNHKGAWYDSQGMMYPLNGRVKGDSLTTIWGQEGDRQGRTTYRMIDRNTMRVRDEIRRAAEWLPYGLTTLVRQPVAKATPAH